MPMDGHCWYIEETQCALWNNCPVQKGHQPTPDECAHWHAFEETKIESLPDISGIGGG